METPKLVWIDGEQIVLFPAGFDLACDEVRIEQQGDKIVLRPVPRKPGNRVKRK